LEDSAEHKWHGNSIFYKGNYRFWINFWRWSWKLFLQLTTTITFHRWHIILLVKHDSLRIFHILQFTVYFHQVKRWNQFCNLIENIVLIVNNEAQEINSSIESSYILQNLLESINLPLKYIHLLVYQKLLIEYWVAPNCPTPVFSSRVWPRVEEGRSWRRKKWENVIY
jgi:hypothetical protein